ncbi:MAG: hypothetical protein PHQ59_05250 [Candidatus Daviesbacteria bacterium]|nr:hypothetical protein [Candidatus Daviesbacteria bacterium]
MKKGKFIVLYGANNLGKSKQVELLEKSLQEKGIKTIRLKYPIYDLKPTGPKINAVLREGLKMPDLDLQKLYAQNRADFEPKLKSYLNAGKWVLAEDYTGTGVAWGMTWGVPLEALEKINKKLLKEDLAILLHGERFVSGIEKNHRNEADDEIWEKGQRIHLELGARYGWKKVYATRTPEEVHLDIINLVTDSFLKNPQPEKELEKDDFKWFVYSEKDTGLRLVCLEDKITGVVITTTIANSKNRTAAHRAWAGARHSRAPGAPWEIMYEMGEKGVDPDQKLDEMFRNYGHKSVGDMAHLEISTHNTPMHLCLALFNNAAVNAGQEKSSRYQSKFKDAALHPIRNYLPDDFPSEELANLEDTYQSFGKLALDLYASHKDQILAAFEKFYKPGDNDKGALNSRVMDCVRFFLPLGACSGLSLDTSARDWSRIISQLKSSPIPFYHRVGFQIEQLFTPLKEIEKSLEFKAEAPSLIRHSEASLITNNSIVSLRNFITNETNFLEEVPINRKLKGKVKQGVNLLSEKYSEGDKMVAQYLLTIWPGLNRKKLLDWVNNQTPNIKKKISEILFEGHNHNQELPLWAGTSGMTLELNCFMGEVRDWNRHRANKRFIPIPLIYGERWTIDTALQVMSCGFGLPLYLTEVPKFEKIAKKFEQDLDDYYEKLYKFVDDVNNKYGDSIDYSFVLNLLPLAHQTDIWMHGDPKQSLYLTHLRARNGGHINYRDLSYKANQLIAKSDPYLSGLKLDKEPNPLSRTELFDRS